MMHTNRVPVSLCLSLVLVALIGGPFHGQAADLSQAVVRQKINVVTVAPTITGPSKPAVQGEVVRDQNVVRTGTESRAELEFTDQTLARLGANALFSFDAQARALNCERGALLFSKPANSGRIELRSGGVSAAITGSTGFLQTGNSVPPPRKQRKQAAVTPTDKTTVLGMLEGKLKGDLTWHDSSGQSHTTHFSMGPGDMLVAQPGRPPVLAQFDLPRFLKTSPLIHGFKGKLHNEGKLQKAVADYESDKRRGFIESTYAPALPATANLAWLAANTPNHTSFDASVEELSALSAGTNNGGTFIPVGSTGIIRGQLIWATDADLDLHLILPDNTEVFYANPSVTFNNNRATAVLDHDNRGGVIDASPDLRIENIAINGTPSSGTYTFFANSFFTSNSSDPFTLHVSGPNTNRTITGTLSNGQNSQSVNVVIPPGG